MRKPSQVERAFALLAIMLYGGAILPLFRSVEGGEAANADGDLVSQFVYLILYIFTIIYISTSTKPVRAALVSSKGLFIIFSLVTLSIVWSDDSLISARRVFALLGSSLFAYYLAASYSLQTILTLVNRALFITAIASVITAITLPGLGVMSALQEGGFHEGAWKGIYIHKNTLGRLMVINALTALILYSITKKKIHWFEMALAVFLIVMSQSSTALILGIFIIGISYLLKSFRMNGYGLILMLLSLLMIGLFSVAYIGTNYELFFELIGKDPTLTGRTALWEQVVIAIGKRPVMGHGFGGFWIGGNSASARISQELNWEIPNAHNGFLDIFLDLGYVGFGVFIVIYISKLFSFMKAYSLHRERVYEWGVMYMLLFLIYNFLESNLLRQNSFLWILFVTTIVSYALQLARSKKNLTKERPLQSPPNPNITQLVY